MTKFIIGVDLQFVYHTFRQTSRKVEFPYEAVRDYIEGKENDVVEMYTTVIRQTPTSSSAEDVAKAAQDFHRVRRALEAQGANVIECPMKQTDRGPKHSDDQRLMIRLALTCTRLKPDFLVLVAADGDYAPLVWGLREEGIRTKLITDETRLAPELRSACYSVSDVFKVVENATSNPVEREY